jgi:peptidoglycan/LPS O-acetylase OafA/YrhL
VASPGTYRADIDYLRAVAVLLVIAFHWQIPGFGGGFVGVDVFFVISGYLITRLIAADLLDGSFSFTGFYLRRARRLLPALYATIFLSAIVGWCVLLPPAMLDFARSAVSVILFSSNILFWRETGYFDLPAAGKPLLHTWSLSVEEQFYLVVPALLWLLVCTWRDRKYLIAVALAAIAALSFGLSCWQTAHAPSAAFYLAPGRAWEFLLGSGLLLVERRNGGSLLPVLAATAGAAMIFAAALFFGPDVPFPGVAALLPCLGTAMILWANLRPSAGAAGLLLNAGAFVGRLSYSLYLWHWPVYVLARAGAHVDDDLSVATKVLLAGPMLALSLLSYATIERPFRTRRRLGSDRAFVTVWAASAAAVAGFTVAAHYFPALTGRYGAEASRVAGYGSGYIYPALFRDGTCFLRPEQGFDDYDRHGCFTVDPRRENVLLWGDSMAAHYLAGLGALAVRDGFNLMQATASSCPPLFGLDVMERPHCRAFNDRVGALIAANRGLVVVMAADWDLPEIRFGNEAFLRMLHTTLKALTEGGARVIVIGSPIRWRQALPALLAEDTERNHGSVDTRTLVLEQQFAQDARLKAALPGVPFISILDTACPMHRCPAFAGDVPLSFDKAHLTKEGSILVVEKIAPQLESYLKR